jgi:hypothetical protein
VIRRVNWVRGEETYGLCMRAVRFGGVNRYGARGF